MEHRIEAYIYLVTFALSTLTLKPTPNLVLLADVSLVTLKESLEVPHKLRFQNGVDVGMKYIGFLNGWCELIRADFSIGEVVVDYAYHASGNEAERKQNIRCLNFYEKFDRLKAIK